MTCPPAASSPGSVTNQVAFPVASSALTATERADIAGAAAAWHAAGGSVRVRVDGYASVEGHCDRNWLLSCRRAQAVAAELEHPTGGVPGVPRALIDVFAHGGSSEFSPTLPPNRNATISMPALPPAPPTPPAPACALPVLLGTGRGCASGPDFTHFDFPSISTSSAAVLAVWASGHPGRGPFRSAVTDFECRLEMDAVLTGLAGGEGHAAFARFAAGTGGVAVHGAGSTLAGLATSSRSFRATLATVKAAIETQLAAQAAAGVLDPCALSLLLPPPTHFTFTDGATLKAVIGGTQGESVFLTRFTGSTSARTYSLDLRFEICDDFGVDESDLYAPGLIPFWVLQHERSATRYAPFVNRLDLTATLSGTL